MLKESDVLNKDSKIEGSEDSKLSESKGSKSFEEIIDMANNLEFDLEKGLKIAEGALDEKIKDIKNELADLREGSSARHEEFKTVVSRYIEDNQSSEEFEVFSELKNIQEKIDGLILDFNKKLEAINNEEMVEEGGEVFSGEKLELLEKEALDKFSNEFKNFSKLQKEYRRDSKNETLKIKFEMAEKEVQNLENSYYDLLSKEVDNLREKEPGVERIRLIKEFVIPGIKRIEEVKKEALSSKALGVRNKVFNVVAGIDSGLNKILPKNKVANEVGKALVVAFGVAGVSVAFSGLSGPALVTYLGIKTLRSAGSIVVGAKLSEFLVKKGADLIDKFDEEKEEEMENVELAKSHLKKEQRRKILKIVTHVVLAGGLMSGVEGVMSGGDKLLGKIIAANAGVASIEVGAEETLHESHKNSNNHH